MTDYDQTSSSNPTPADGGSTSMGGTTPPTGADETFGWTSDDQASGNSDARATAERMLGQLQSMIDTIAVQAAPVVRQIGAKAAELAAVAADRAGPLAQRAADATADASVKIAERSRTLAADLRSRAEAGAEGTTDGGSGATGDYGSPPLTGVDDATERSAKDDPAEGRPL